MVYHLCEAELWEELFEVVTDVKWLLARAKLDYLGVVLDLEHAAARCHFLHPTTPKGFRIWFVVVFWAVLFCFFLFFFLRRERKKKQEIGDFFGKH